MRPMQRSLFDGLVLTAVGERRMAVLEEVFEPGIELVGVEVEFIAQVGDRDLIDEMPLEDGDLLGAGKMTTQFAHDEPPIGLC